MKTTDEIDKIKAVVLYILNQCGGSQDFVSLAKKMYFAQREYLALYGRPIFNDTFYARERGPVPTFTYKSLSICFGKSDCPEEIKAFNDSFSVTSTDGYKVVTAIEKPDMDELALAEVETMDEILKRTEGLTAEQLSDLSHKDSAWKKAKKRMEEDPTDGRMSLVSIARAGGASQGTIKYLQETLNFDYWCKA